MRLAVVSPFVDRRHGTERAVAELLERLARDYGCEIHLYAQRVEDLLLTDPEAQHHKELGAIFWHRVPAIPGPHLLQFLAWMFFNGLLRKWHKIVRGLSCDLLLSPGINCLHPDFVIVHALFHRLRALSLEQKPPAQPGNGLLRHLHRNLYYQLLTYLEKRIYSDSRVSLAAVSQRTAGLLQMCFRRNGIPVVPNGVDGSYFSPAARLARRGQSRQEWKLGEGEFVLLLIGNDWNTKGLPTLLRALAALGDLPVRLLIVGADSPAPFQSLSAHLGVEDRCIFERPRSDVMAFYCAADAYVSPSREDAFPLPVVEAMACGMPVVTSVFAGNCVEDGVTGFVLEDPRDVPELANVLRRLWSDALLRTRVSDAAAAAASCWTWDRSAAALSQLLTDRMTSESK